MRRVLTATAFDHDAFSTSVLDTETVLMADEPFYAPNAKPPPPRIARPGEPLFSFVREHDRFACDLR